MTDILALLANLAPFWFWEYNCEAMQIVNFPDLGHKQIGATGACPHCHAQTVLQPLVSHQEAAKEPSQFLIATVTRCIGCKKFALVTGRRYTSNGEYNLEHVFPFGSPQDEIDKSVPKPIAADFAEAIRCEFIKAYKGTVTLCRRAVQASALEKKAPKNRKLIEQIDWLEKQGIITESLRRLAHEVRLTGNEGAHPDKDNLSDVSPGDAQAIVAFTREYLHHVYVMPAALEARLKAKAAATPPATQP